MGNETFDPNEDVGRDVQKGQRDKKQIGKKISRSAPRADQSNPAVSPAVPEKLVALPDISHPQIKLVPISLSPKERQREIAQADEVFKAMLEGLKGELDLPPPLPMIPIPPLVLPQIPGRYGANTKSSVENGNQAYENKGESLPKNVRDAIRILEKMIPGTTKGKNVVWITDLETWLTRNNFPNPREEYSRLMNQGAAGFHLSGKGHEDDVFLIGQHSVYRVWASYDRQYSTDLFARVVSALIYHEILHGSFSLEQHSEIVNKEIALLERMLIQARVEFNHQERGITFQYVAFLQGMVFDQQVLARRLKAKELASQR